MTYTDRQLRLERLMAERGRERYRSAVAQIGHRISRNAAGRGAIQSVLPDLVAKVQGWVEDHTRHRGRLSGGVEVLAALAPEVAGAIGLQSMMDGAAAGFTRHRIVYGLAANLEDERLFSELRRQHKPLFERMMVKRNLSPHALAKWARVWAEDDIFSYNRAPAIERSQAALVVYTLILELGLFTEVKRKVVNRKHMQTFLILNEETREWMDHTHDRLEYMFPVYLPMVQPPADWAPGVRGGYITDYARRKPLVRAHRKRFVDTLKQADMPEVFAAVNTIQRTPWRVNEHVLEVAQDLWDGNRMLAGLPNRDEPDMPAPAEITFEWRRRKRLAYEVYAAEQPLRLGTTRVLSMAREFVGAPFYLPVHLDWRGRFYTVPQWLSYQGTDLSKALLCFDEPCQVNHQAARRWLEYGAELWGAKGTRDELRAEGAKLEPLVRETHQDPLTNLAWSDADKPFQFLAWALEYGEWLDNPLAPVRVPLHMDGTNNGLQIYALLLRDEQLARATNVYPNERPADIYAEVAEGVMGRLRADDNPYAAQWLGFLGEAGLPRDAVKRPVMTLPYGATAFGCQAYVREWLYAEQKRKDTYPWGFESFRPCTYLADLVWTEILRVAGPAVRCMEWLHAVSDAATDAEEPLVWVADSGFPVCQDYPRRKRSNIQAVVGGVQTWVRHMRDGDRSDRRRNRQGVAPNFVHSLDAAIMTKTVNRVSDIPWAPVHDSYGVPVAQADRVAQAIRHSYAEMFAENQLENLKHQVRLDLPDPPELGDLDPNCVLDSEYFF